MERNQTGTKTRAFVLAWAFTVVFYFLEYAVKSSPAVMIPELESSFHTTALGISAVLWTKRVDHLLATFRISSTKSQKESSGC